MCRFENIGKAILFAAFCREMKFSKENLKQGEKFFTPDFFKSMESLQTENDVFTTDSNDFPRAFRIGSCKVIEPTKTNVEILLLWRTDVESRQQIIQAEVIKQSDKWLINKILR